MTQEEQIRLYRLMEKLNWFFHQEMHYLNRGIEEKTARECYPEIRDFTYDILWNDLPKEEMCIRDRFRTPALPVLLDFLTQLFMNSLHHFQTAVKRIAQS